MSEMGAAACLIALLGILMGAGCDIGKQQARDAHCRARGLRFAATLPSGEIQCKRVTEEVVP